jgi:hypothetical protein
MKHLILTLAAVCVLSGCAATPKAMKELGVLHEEYADKPFRPYSECAVREFDKVGGLSNNLRIYDDYAEVVSSNAVPIAYTEFRKEGSGTIARVYVSDSLVSRETMANNLQDMLRSCAKK